MCANQACVGRAQEMMNEAAGVKAGDPPASVITEEQFIKIMEKPKVTQ